MGVSLQLIVNGCPREFRGLEDGAPLTQLVEAMALQPDRVAIERNGKIVSRRSWAEVSLAGGDKLEIVHFVGGGIGPVESRTDLRKSW